MALLFLDSFDHYDRPSEKYTGGNANDSSTFVPGRHGKGLVSNGCSISLAPASPRCIVGGAWFPKFHFNTYFTIVDQNDSVLWLQNVGDGALEIGMFGADGFGTTSVVARSAPDIIKQNTQWYFLELDVTLAVNPDRSVLASVCKVYVDGALVIDAVNLGPTLIYPHQNSTHGWNTVMHGTSGHVSIIDDFYVCDGAGPAPWNAPLGDVQIDVIRPNGAGADTQWAAVGAASNWDATNDLTPDGDTTRVQAASAGLSDLYQLEDLATGNGILGAQLLVSARRSEEGFAQLTPLLRHAGVTTPLPGRNVSPSFSYRNRDCFVTMPNGDPLTDANINALQAGIRRTL